MMNLEEIISQFAMDGNPVAVAPHGNGHINRTYLVTCDSKKRYMLQRISEAFEVNGLMQNIQAVTSWIRNHSDDPRATMSLIPTKDGNLYLHTEDGNFRMYDFVEGTIVLQAVESPADFYECAAGFGLFQNILADFPAETLTEPIKNFHNTVDRYRIFHETLERDPEGRAASVQPEIQFYLDREKEAGILLSMLEAGELPLRVTHNDTKLNNVLYDAETRKAVCVIDLDTVMPGLSLYDYGDAIRYGASTAAEDEQDLDKVALNLELFKTFTDGYLTACPSLTEAEIRMMPMGAKMMTLECGLRFLTDHIDGDHYFAIHRENHNLDRCRTQIKLVKEMEAKWDEMNRIVAELSSGKKRLQLF